MESAGQSDVRRRVQPLADALAADAPLDELALAVSALFRPDLDLIGSLADLDELAAACATPTREGVMQTLFESGRFAGDHESYHHWRNSCLDHVLATRRGMPITLSIVAVEVARRVGVRLVGVGLPGHFLVGDGSDPEWFADPYHARTGLTADDCRQIVGRVGQWSDRFLEPTPDRLVIARILNNLRVSCERDPVRLSLVMQARQTMIEFADEHDDAVRSLSTFN